jgi:hypothetical protein
MPSGEGRRRAHGAENSERLRIVGGRELVDVPPDAEAGENGEPDVGAEANAARRCLRVGCPRDIPSVRCRAGSIALGFVLRHEEDGQRRNRRRDSDQQHGVEVAQERCAALSAKVACASGDTDLVHFLQLSTCGQRSCSK